MPIYGVICYYRDAMQRQVVGRAIELRPKDDSETKFESTSFENKMFEDVPSDMNTYEAM